MKFKIVYMIGTERYSLLQVFYSAKSANAMLRTLENDGWVAWVERF